MLWNLRPIIPRGFPSSMAQFAAFKLAAFHTPCTFYRKRIGLLCWRFFTRGVTLSFGNRAHNRSLVRTPVGAAQFGRWAFLRACR